MSILKPEAESGTAESGTAQEAPALPKPKGNTIKIDTPLDYSFMKIINPADLLAEKPRGMKGKPQGEKYSSKSIKLNNNHLQELPDLMDVISEVILKPADITWIDLSFNQLSHIDPVLCEFPCLNILYLHANKIEEISEVDKLHNIRSLRKLAVHGNTIENVPHYRAYVLSKVPQLINLDMSTVTKSDRETATRFFKAKVTMGHHKRMKHDE